MEGSEGAAAFSIDSAKLGGILALVTVSPAATRAGNRPR